MSARADDSWIRLSADVVSARVLVWIARAGRNGDLTVEGHLYFADRYQRLASLHRRHGDHARARRLQCKADDHLGVCGGDGPPYAAAMALPRPRRWIQTDAVSRVSLNEPDDAA